MSQWSVNRIIPALQGSSSGAELHPPPGSSIDSSLHIPWLSQQPVLQDFAKPPPELPHTAPLLSTTLNALMSLKQKMGP